MLDFVITALGGGFPELSLHETTNLNSNSIGTEGSKRSTFPINEKNKSEHSPNNFENITHNVETKAVDKKSIILSNQIRRGPLKEIYYDESS